MNAVPKPSSGHTRHGDAPEPHSLDTVRPGTHGVPASQGAEKLAFSALCARHMAVLPFSIG